MGEWPATGADLGDLVETVVAVPMPVALDGGTGNAWANPHAAGTDRGLVVAGGFVVDKPRWRALAQRVEAVGFADLGACLAARYQDGCSLVEVAAELGTSTWMIGAAMDAFGVARAPGPAARGRSCRARSDRHVAARVGCAGVRGGGWLPG